MKGKLILLILFSSPALLCFSQQEYEKDVVALNKTINKFLSVREQQAHDVNSELCVIHFLIDSVGHVANIHILNDSTDQDAIYSILATMTVHEFADLELPNSAGKEIVMPLLIYGTIGFNYADGLFNYFMYDSSLQFNKSIYVAGDFIFVLRPCLYISTQFPNIEVQERKRLIK